MINLSEKLISIRPSERQLNWHKLEFYSFIHFGMNTFYDREWGNGKEDPNEFNPTNLNTDQWVESLKNANIKAVILTCKHHDGFCLWPSKYTEHSIKNSPYKNGKGDIVKELSNSCKKYGLKFGVYLSPWDMNSKLYGTDEYNEFFKNQLTELLTEYGELFSVWFDGACGEGENGKKQIYDWDGYYSLIRKLQPNACITICGPDVRWCGNEAGHCRKQEWNVVPARLSKCETVQENSQKNDDSSFRERKISPTDEDLGSQEVLKDEKDLIWYPCEVDTSIRNGWFYHKNEDPKPLEKLLNIYYNSVGANATLLLNIPPNKEGLIDDKDVQILKQIGNHINNTFKENIANQAQIKVDIIDNNTNIYNVLSEDDKFYKGIDSEEKATITFKFDSIKQIKTIVLKEQIALSQRIEEFEIYAKVNNNIINVFNGTIVGSKRICKLNNVNTDYIEIRILKSRVCPTLNFVGIYT